MELRDVLIPAFLALATIGWFVMVKWVREDDRREAAEVARRARQIHGFETFLSRVRSFFE